MKWRRLEQYHQYSSATTQCTVFTGDQLTTIGANVSASIPNVYPTAGKYSLGIFAAGGQSVATKMIANCGIAIYVINLPAIKGMGTYTAEITAQDRSSIIQTVM